MTQRIKAWFERAVGVLFPVWFWGKLFRWALRRVHSQSDRYLTFHSRPKRAGEMGIWSDPRKQLPSMAVVMQGPLLLQDDFTVETVRLYRRTFAGCPLIVSTWEGEDSGAVARLREAGAEVLLNAKPAFAGFMNTNLQLVSALAGVRRARELGASHVLKCRTDQRMYAANIPAFLLGLLDAFPPAPGTGQRKRIVGTSLASHKYIMYQFSDMTVFGHSDDVLAYYDIPLSSTRSLPPNFRNVIGDRINAPEHYFATRFLQRIGHDAEWSLNASWRALADHFLIIDRHSLDLVWFKYNSLDEYPSTDYSAVSAGREMSFADWLALRALASDPSVLAHAIQSQELPMSAEMPSPGD